MSAPLPPDLLHLISQTCPSREAEAGRLAAYYKTGLPSPPITVVYGLEYIKKTEVVGCVLKHRGIRHAIIRSGECLSQRHLLSKIFTGCISGLGRTADLDQYEKPDNINALLGNLRKLLERSDSLSFVVVIEEVDKLKQTGPTLLSSLARMGDEVPGLSVILTTNSLKPIVLHKSGVPYIHFRPYTRAEMLFIITTKGPPELHDGCHVPVDDTTLSKIYAQFATTVYDTLLASTTMSIETLHGTCNKLWPTFISPLVLGQPPPGTGRAGSWDFSKLIVHNRGLFQSRGEHALHDHLPRHALSADMDGSISSESRNVSAETSHGPTSTSLSPGPPLLKHFATLILLAAYLASHTPPKHDFLLFSRLSSASITTNRKIRRLRRTPTKRKPAIASMGRPLGAETETSTPKKTRVKTLFGGTALLAVARPFTLDRLVAILRAIHPSGLSSRPDGGISDRVYHELGELEKLRLVIRVNGAGLGSGFGISTTAANDDTTEEKWRVNVGRDWVISMGMVWAMGIADYEIEHED